MNLAVFLPNWVGDLVMATPALRAVRRQFPPPARLVGVVRPNLMGLLDGTEWLDDLWLFDPHGSTIRHGRLQLVARMRRRRFDTAILLTNSLHTALLAWLGGARQRIGYAMHGRGALLTRKLHPSRDGSRIRPVPMVENYMALASAVGCSPESPQLELVVTADEFCQAAAAWRSLGLRTDGRVVALNSGGAYGAAKVWPVEHCGALARHIVRELDHDVLVLCSHKERAAARAIVSYAASPRVFSLADQPTGLGLTKACLARSRLLVSTDSGPRHIAAALGTPVITLLGPTLPVWIENPTVDGVMLQANVACLGCGKRRCPLRHHRCMRELWPDMVASEVERALCAPRIHHAGRDAPRRAA
jgi:heptosyltransferase II